MLPGLAILSAFADGGIAGSFRVDISQDQISKTGSTKSTPKDLTTNTVTVTPSGGSGSYSHDWSSGTASIISPTDASSATTAFTGTFDPGQSETAVFVDTVTDTVTGLILTTSVEVTMELVSFL